MGPKKPNVNTAALAAAGPPSNNGNPSNNGSPPPYAPGMAPPTANGANGANGTNGAPPLPGEDDDGTCPGVPSAFPYLLVIIVLFVIAILLGYLYSQSLATLATDAPTITSQAGQIQTLQKQYSNMATNLATEAAQYTGAVEAYNVVNNELATQQATNTTLTNQIASLNSQLAADGTQITGLNTNITGLNTKISNLTYFEISGAYLISSVTSVTNASGTTTTTPTNQSDARGFAVFEYLSASNVLMILYSPSTPPSSCPTGSSGTPPYCVTAAPSPSGTPAPTYAPPTIVRSASTLTIDSSYSLTGSGLAANTTMSWDGSSKITQTTTNSDGSVTTTTYTLMSN